MSTTIRVYKDCGPYWDPDTDIHVLNNLADLIGWVRHYMSEEIPDCIAIYNNDNLIGGWLAEGDVEPDGEGGMYPIHCGYERVSPDSWHWTNNLFRHTCKVTQ